MPTTTGEIQIRRGAASLWASTNRVLADGEWGKDDAGNVKLGNGVTNWNSLPNFVNSLAKATVDNSGSVGQYLAKSSSGVAWTTLTLSSFTNVVVDTPENHGARRDGIIINDAAMASGSAVLNSASGKFTAQMATDHIPIMVDGAISGAGTLITTIQTYTSPTQVTLAASNSSGGAIANKAAIFGHDDTAFIKAAINNAVATAQANGQNYAEVWFTAGIYMVCGGLDTTQSGNAQIPLPFISMTGPKFILNLVGSGDGALIPHWRQNVIQFGGPTLVTNLNAAFDATHGDPSVIGGPTLQGMGSPSDPGARFMNMKLTGHGLFFVSPQNPKGWVLDLQCVGQHDLDKIGFNASVIPAQSAVFADTAYTQFPTFGGGGGAFRMPQIGNNDFCHVGSIAVEGYDIAIEINEHAHIETATIVYCQVGILGANPMAHGAIIDYLSTESCQYHLDFPNPAAQNLNVMKWDIEEGEGSGATVYHLSDPNSNLKGELHFHANGDLFSPLVNGGAAVKLINESVAHGFQTSPPAAPTASDTSIHNPFWRDAQVYITAGGAITDISIGAVGFEHSTGLTFAAGATGMVVVPTHMNIKITYSGANPTWRWFTI